MIYISGKITGLPIEVAKENFQTAKAELRKAYEFEKIVNPMEVVPFNEQWTWHDYMVEDIKYLLKCSAIYMLKNWGDSKGARIERAIAIESGLQIMYQE